ncbi:hypothetical protein M5D96_000299 [Drosophila gunungcola]|uniref:Uncharacterized protein n=1 Tax=Drosophila gunungcola TaxID=103775 RepID=A0A9P9YW13_9MUSC|nr:hypothetical protein M5D96_000299 [Drosophila gunungcola]
MRATAAGAGAGDPLTASSATAVAPSATATTSDNAATKDVGSPTVGGSTAASSIKPPQIIAIEDY